MDGIQDPHNVGAILRTCDCAGVDGVILTKHNSCGLTPTVVKASTGAAYTVPVSIVTNLSQTLRNLKQEGYWVVGTDMKDAREYREGMYDSPTVLVIGSEGQGISNTCKKTMRLYGLLTDGRKYHFIKCECGSCYLDV